MTQAPLVFKKSEMLKISKVAKRLGVSRQHIYNMIDAGKLLAFRFGFSRNLFVPIREVEKMENHSES